MPDEFSEKVRFSRSSFPTVTRRLRDFAFFSDIQASISLERGLLLPTSAIFLIPEVAFFSAAKSWTSPLWVMPISPEKWGLEGKSTGWVAELHRALNVNSYFASSSEGVSLLLVLIVSVLDSFSFIQAENHINSMMNDSFFSIFMD